jgi:hypothetical protein
MDAMLKGRIGVRRAEIMRGVVIGKTTGLKVKSAGNQGGAQGILLERYNPTGLLQSVIPRPANIEFRELQR